jgi:Domain of unknown function (DUF4160)
MPTIMRWRGWRVQFYSADGDEPRHVHVRRGDAQVKIWLHDLSIARSYDVNARDLAAIVGMVRDRRDELTEAWDGYFEHRDQ